MYQLWLNLNYGCYLCSTLNDINRIARFERPRHFVGKIIVTANFLRKDPRTKREILLISFQVMKYGFVSFDCTIPTLATLVLDTRAVLLYS